MLRISIESSDVVEKNGTKKDGSPFSLRLQEAWAYLGLAHPQRIELPIWKEDVPYEVGEYTLDPASFQVSRYGNLEFKRSIKLVKTKVKGA